MGTDAKKPAKQKSRLHMTHAQNDARYIAQGMTLFLSPNPDSAKDLARMNKGKNGRPFIYDEETMMVIAGIVYQLGLACRGCEGLAIMALGEENAPDHTTIWRRINKMKICVNSMLCLMARPQIHLPNVKTCLDVVNTYTTNMRLFVTNRKLFRTRFFSIRRRSMCSAPDNGHCSFLVIGLIWIDRVWLW